MRKNFLRALLIIPILVLVAGIVFYIWLAHDLPQVETMTERLVPPSVRITDRNGRLLYEVLPADSGRHTIANLGEIPIACQQATIATEDRYFYQNPGVDVFGIVRAFWINLVGGEVRAGGSTITQQVVRTLLFEPGERNEITLRRKMREALLAFQLTRQYSKSDILASYLNHTYYGGMAYGIEAAAQTFFGKSVSELDTAECAMLAGLPQSPAQYNPFTNPDLAKNRQQIVLNLMLEQRYLTEVQYELAEAEPLTYAATPYPIEAPHFVMMVRNQLDTLFTTEDIYTHGGLIVRTTLDLDWQHLAEHAITTQIRKVKEETDGVGHNLNSAALVAIQPTTGEVMALVGSPDYFDTQIGGAINMVLSPRQPGSSIKPLVYAAAFEPASGITPWTPATMILDVSTTFYTGVTDIEMGSNEPYIPKNYDGLEHGPVLARQALASSLNIPAVKTLDYVGLDKLSQLAGHMGISTLRDFKHFDLSLALGGGEVRLLELTAAYASFANSGLGVTPYFIETVTTADGSVLYQNQTGSSWRVLDERVAWLISDILSDNDARLLGFGDNSVLRLDRPAAVKTGTTTNWHDNWTIGYTPQLVVGVWAGNTNYEPMRDITGLTGAAPIWHQFIREALSGTPILNFERPDGLVQVKICALSGLLPSADCPYTRMEWFIEGTQPRQVDALYQRIVIDKATRRLADESTPAERRSEIVVLDLPSSALNWAHSQGINLFNEYNYPSVTQDSNATGLSITSPAANSIYRITTGLPDENQRISIAASVATNFSQVSIWIDGQQFAIFTEGPYEIWWELAPGKHEIWAEGTLANGEKETSQRVKFEVLGIEP